MFKFLKDRYAKKQVNLILAEGIFDFIVYINIKQGTYLRKYEKKNLPYSLQKEGKYEELLQSMQNMLCTDAEEFAENMKLLHILGKLSLQEPHAVHCRLLIKGQIYHKRMLFCWDNRKENIVAFGEDVSGAAEWMEAAAGMEAQSAEKRQEMFSGNTGSSADDTADDITDDTTAYLAHEIRTSLNSLCGALHIIQDAGTELSENGHFENAVMSADYLQRLVNNILYIDGAENGKNVMELKAVTLEELAEYPRSIFEQAAAEKNIQLQFLIEEPIYQYLYLCKDIVWQIVINLLSNAVKYTDDGGSVICHMAETYLEEKRVELLIEVTDTGIGMEPAFLSTAWESYTRERRRKEVQGSGLGLAITKRLAELLGGSISIASQTGAGTKVSVKLEADGDDILYAQLMPASPPVTDKDSEKTDAVKRVLVAEDEENSMEILCQYLCKLGIAADRAHDGREVIEIFKQSEENYYDVILMDLHMPDINGVEAVRTIRNMNREDSTLPVIAITADSRILSDEINACIMKPYCIEDIRYTLLKRRR